MHRKYEMRDACFVCTTPYQILGAVSIACEEKVKGDIYVFGTFSGYKEIADRLDRLELFENVYKVDCKEMNFFGKGLSKAEVKARIIFQMIFPNRCFKGVLDDDIAY